MISNSDALKDISKFRSGGFCHFRIVTLKIRWALCHNDTIYTVYIKFGQHSETLFWSKCDISKWKIK